MAAGRRARAGAVGQAGAAARARRAPPASPALRQRRYGSCAGGWLWRHGGHGGRSARGGTAGGGGGTGRPARAGAAAPAGGGGWHGAGGTGGGAATGCPGGLPCCARLRGRHRRPAPTNATRWTLSLNGTGTIRSTTRRPTAASKSMHIDGLSRLSHDGHGDRCAAVSAASWRPLRPSWLRLASDPGFNSHLTWIEAGLIANDQAETRIGYNIRRHEYQPFARRYRATRAERETSGGDVVLRGFSCSTLWRTRRASGCGQELYRPPRHELGGRPITANGNNNSPIPNWAPNYQAVRFGWELQRRQHLVRRHRARLRPDQLPVSRIERISWPLNRSLLGVTRAGSN